MPAPHTEAGTFGLHRADIMNRRSFLPQSIAGRLTVWFLLIALVPSVLLVVTMFLIIRSAAETAARDQLQYVLSDRMLHVQNWIEERGREVSLLSQMPRLIDVMKQYQVASGGQPDAGGVFQKTGADAEVRRKVLAELTDVVDPIAVSMGYPNVLIFDPSGELLHTMDDSFELSGNINQGPLRDSALAKAVNEAISRRTLAISRPERYPNAKDDEFRYFETAPIQSENQLLGVIAIRLDNAEFDEVFSNYEGLGESGDYYAGVLQGKQVAILAPLRHDPTGALERVPYPLGGPNAEALQEAAQQREGSGIKRDYRGIECLSRWVYDPVLGLGIVAEKDIDEAYASVALFRWASLALLGLTSLLVIPVAYFVARSLSRPMASAMSLAQEVSAGNLTADVPNAYSGEPGRLIDAIKNMSGHLRRLIGHIQHSIVTLMSTATEFAATSRQQQQTVDEYGKSTVQVATAVNEISATSQSLLRTMREINESANRAAELATTGQSSLAGMHQTMSNLADSTGSISSRLSVISERANNITLVVTTITKVADQTNLLSINAAIEAEKAGEYGRGFLVVAREIRRLADQTAVATLDIERIVREMQQSVSAGVMEMDKFNEQVRLGVGDVGRIGDQLNQIIHAVQVLLPRFEQVSEGMAAQSQGADQIRDAMAQLSEGVSQTSESLREFNKATDQLREAVLQLKDDISKFTT